MAMSRRSLGSTGIEVSRVLLGCGSIGGLGSPRRTRGLGLTAEEGREQIQSAVDSGINVLDTADSYAGGESERVVGQWLADHLDADVLVETKVGNLVDPGQEHFDLSAAHIARQVEVSLSRLGRIDLYLSHAPDARTPIEETLEAFAALLQSATIRAFGACNLSAVALEESLDAAERLGLPSYGWVQCEYNLLARAAEADLFPLVRERGLGLTPFSPLAGGLLSGMYVPGETPPPGSHMAVAPDMMRPLDERTGTGLRSLAVHAEERQVSTAGLALAWVLSAPEVTAPLVSPESRQQLDSVEEALALRLDADERDHVAGYFA